MSAWRTPEFWYRPPGLWSAVLSPAGHVYAAATRQRLARGPAPGALQPALPVIGVGNLTAGGAGKTPLVAALTRSLQAAGLHPVILSRGHGGRVSAPLRVDPARDTAAAVGDEPLMLARSVPVVVARQRLQGAAAVARLVPQAEVIVLDDGHQDPALRRDLALVVVSGALGFGNRHCVPAGPLREPVAAGLARAHGVVVVGPDRHAVATLVPAGVCVLYARTALNLGPLPHAGRPVVAFAGIAHPHRFFADLEAAGVTLAATLAFRDHHAYTAADLARLQALSQRHGGAVLVTTVKDHVRLPAAVAAAVVAVPLDLQLCDPVALEGLLRRHLPMLPWPPAR